jgi:hypothetical protein
VTTRPAVAITAMTERRPLRRRPRVNLIPMPPPYAHPTNEAALASA